MWTSMEHDYRGRSSSRDQGRCLGFGPPKSKTSIRTIEIDEETIALLREQNERQRFASPSMGARPTGLTWTLSSAGPGARPEDPNVVNRRFAWRVQWCSLTRRAALTFPMKARRRS